MVDSDIQALTEMRDSSIHFYNRSGAFPVRLQEIGTASLKNFVAACRSWFDRDLSEFNFYLMPLSFIALPQQTEAVVLNQEEKKFLAFIDRLEPADDDGTSPYSVTVNIDIIFSFCCGKEKVFKRTGAPAILCELKRLQQEKAECDPFSMNKRT